MNKGKQRCIVAVHSLGARVVPHGYPLVHLTPPSSFWPNCLKYLFIHWARVVLHGYPPVHLTPPSSFWPNCLRYFFQPLRIVAEARVQNDVKKSGLLLSFTKPSFIFLDKLPCFGNCIFLILACCLKNISLIALKVIDSGLQGHPGKFPHLLASNI